MKLRAIIILTIYAIFTIFAGLWMAKQSYSWLPPEASAESKLYDDLFSLFTGLGTLIYLGVMGPFIYSLFAYKAAKYDLNDATPIQGNTWLEITWTGIPLLLVLALSFVSYRTYEKMSIQGPTELVHLHMPQMMQTAYAEPFDDTPQKEIQGALETAPVETIEVLARQWAWVFHYPKQNVTSTELHLPVDRRTRFKLHSEDVLHGFYIPAFRLSQYVVPNEDIDLELTPVKTGTYRLRDSMMSGTYFAANQTDVVVQSRSDYEQWLADAATQTPTPAFNPAADEYARGQAEGGRAKEKTAVRGWATIAPAPPPVVNYAPKHLPKSPAT
ncbi:MAG: cytochrome c oxidase subunit II [Leptolyngbya sp. Prado105]|jgi:cytochrome c oxidase subunit 2|nr:cytochrome c oxidase subunit II [Leptolyngbya sp. Prado105]